LLILFARHKGSKIADFVCPDPKGSKKLILFAPALKGAKSVYAFSVDNLL
jgi:hypothetical protein